MYYWVYARLMIYCSDVTVCKVEFYMSFFPIPHSVLQGLSTEELRTSASDVLERQLSLVFDVLMMHQIKDISAKR